MAATETATTGTTVLEPATTQRTALAPRYKVLIHNDDTTPMDFVVALLLDIFKKSIEDSVQIMLTAHHTGLALVDVLPLEQAEFRIEQAHSMARTAKFPLTFTCEPE